MPVFRFVIVYVHDVARTTRRDKLCAENGQEQKKKRIQFYSDTKTRKLVGILYNKSRFQRLQIFFFLIINVSHRSSSSKKKKKINSEKEFVTALNVLFLQNYIPFAFNDPQIFRLTFFSFFTLKRGAHRFRFLPRKRFCFVNVTFELNTRSYIFFSPFI